MYRTSVVTGRQRQRTLHRRYRPSFSLVSLPLLAMRAFMRRSLSVLRQWEVVVALSGMQLRRVLTRPSTTGPIGLLSGVHEVLEDLRVVYVGGGEDYGERYDSGRN